MMLHTTRNCTLQLEPGAHSQIVKKDIKIKQNAYDKAKIVKCSLPLTAFAYCLSSKLRPGKRLLAV